MPIYEYTCKQCADAFELLIRGNEAPACPACGSQSLEKQLSVPAAHLASSSELPICQRPMPSGGCGLPQCGGGTCAGM